MDGSLQLLGERGSITACCRYIALVPKRYSVARANLLKVLVYSRRPCDNAARESADGVQMNKSASIVDRVDVK